MIKRKLNYLLCGRKEKIKYGNEKKYKGEKNKGEI